MGYISDLNLTQNISSQIDPLPPLVMRIQPKIIEHLGINMYTYINPVICELIANSWDADAVNVYVTVPDEPMSEKYAIIVRDAGGNGMTHGEILEKYLQVGRNRRIRDSDPKQFVETSPKFGRRILGRKGIGKLSVFGVAQNVVVKSIRNGRVTEFEMDVEDIKKVSSGEYMPKELQVDQMTTEEDGVTIILKNLKRKRKIEIDDLRRGIARRFTLLGDNFQVYVNNIAITPDDRKIDDINHEWIIDESIPEHHDWKITGKIFTRIATINEEEQRGVAIFAGRKLVQEPTFFGAGVSGKTFAYSHLMGELNAEFLDGENDVIATNRSSINWESEEGQALKSWGFKKIKSISNEWNTLRLQARTDTVMKNDEFQKWFDGLSKTEKARATKVLNVIIGNDDLSDERIKNLANFVKDSFEFASFQELADKIEEANPVNASLIVELFQEWEHLEAKEMYRIMEGRIATIEKLRWYIDNNAKEIPVIHDYLKSFPWIIDPRWTIIEDELKYSDLLRKKFPDNETDKRIDFLCYGSWPNAIVVELKRPGWTISKKDLDQIREYVIFVESLIGSDPELSYKKVYGYLICEDMQKSEINAKRIIKLQENGIFVRKYSELLSITEHIHKDMIDRYKKLTKITKAK